MSSKLYSKQQKWRESHDKKLSTARAAVTAATDVSFISGYIWGEVKRERGGVCYSNPPNNGKSKEY